MFESLQQYRSGIGDRINQDYFADEETLVRALAETAGCPDPIRQRVEGFAAELVRAVRDDRSAASGLDSFLQQYDLSSTEGVALMCLAEALLRVPDADTADLLIADRLAAGDWQSHLGESESLFVNASTWGLMLTGRMILPDAEVRRNPAGFIRHLVARLGEPIVRAAFLQAMQIMGQQFVMGHDIEAALKRSRSGARRRDRYSFDMLGEAALTAEDADEFHAGYLRAIERLGDHNAGSGDVMAGAGVSIKLSALSPRLELAQIGRVRREVVPRVRELVMAARDNNVSLTIDAEEARRLELGLLVFEMVFDDRAAADWPGFGIVVQTYQRRGTRVLEWLEEKAQRAGRTIPVRLVKGAYWDAEIKYAQESGWPGYPVFTRKVNTDIAFLAGVRRLLHPDSRLWPQFATHNAHALAYILEHAPPGREFEFQRLHGMGEVLFEKLAELAGRTIPCRVYAPVGKHEDLLPYLVRRLLENGSNTSFVNRIVDEDLPAEELVKQPAPVADRPISNPRIPVPRDLFGDERANSEGLNFFDGASLARLGTEMDTALAGPHACRPVIDGEAQAGPDRPVSGPVDRRRQIGRVAFTSAAQVDRAVDGAVAAFGDWNRTPVEQRAAALRRAADRFEACRAELVALCVAEAGKCLPDALSEVREAVDFLRYYAAEAERLMARPTLLPGPTGERNELLLAGRGAFVCISPWNFPVAIYTGQIAAALVTGNSVVAKPAEQTSLVAARIVELLHESGIPPGVLQFVPGTGADTGVRAVSNPRIAGVVFTGSTETAQAINRSLAARDAPIATLIAETGGQNAMIVDSTALAEQVVVDVAHSAFNSAGQRCSALRVLFVQQDVAGRVIRLLQGYMAEWRVADPARLDTDVGPVIDERARQALRDHREKILAVGRLIYECSLPDGHEHGCFFAPLAVEIDDIAILEREVFGPVLHVVRFGADAIDEVVASIERLGYGLTFGIQSRIERRGRELAARIGVGNVYVNRNIIGAVVGVQPFGGRGLSGTGPKAGGPHYLQRFVTEKTICVNTAAVGGNATLLAQN